MPIEAAETSFPHQMASGTTSHDMGGCLPPGQFQITADAVMRGCPGWPFDSIFTLVSNLEQTEDTTGSPSLNRAPPLDPVPVLSALMLLRRTKQRFIFKGHFLGKRRL